MFLMFGIDPRQIALQYDKTFICSKCGKYGRYQVVMTCMCFSLFLIPIFKFAKHYYVTSTCCHQAYELDPAIGRLIRKGVDVEIRDDHLTPLQQGTHGTYEQTGYSGTQSQNKGAWESGAEHRTYADGELRCCQKCGYMTRENFEYCPKCGNHF